MLLNKYSYSKKSNMLAGKGYMKHSLFISSEQNILNPDWDYYT